MKYKNLLDNIFIITTDKQIEKSEITTLPTIYSAILRNIHSQIFHLIKKSITANTFMIDGQKRP